MGHRVYLFVIVSIAVGFSGIVFSQQSQKVPSMLDVTIGYTGEYQIEYPTNERIVRVEITIICGNIIKTTHRFYDWSISNTQLTPNSSLFIAETQQSDLFWSGYYHNLLTATVSEQRCFDIEIVLITETERECYIYHVYTKKNLFYEPAP